MAGNRIMKIHTALVILVLLFGTVLPAGAADESIGGDQGWYVIHCNIYGSKVYLDDKYVGTTEMGTLTVPALTMGTPYRVIRVEKHGYSTFTDSITKVPGKGMSVDLYATLNVLPETTATSIGGDMGWYVVHCNIDGATVLFDTSNKGEISRGAVYVPVYSTGTPYQTLTVKKEGYRTYTANIGKVPAKGETIDLYATLNPVATATVTTPGLIGGDIGWYNVHCNVEGATVSFNNEAKGKIADGSLSVQVYVTGTPYRTFTVYKAGYVPFSGPIEQYPKKGETVDLYATLNALPDASASATPAPTAKSPLPLEVSLLALVFCGMGVILGIRKN
jgi:hypothetical protein